MKKNKIATTLLALMLATSIIPVNTFAQEENFDTIVPFDTSTIVSLNTQTTNNIYIGQRNTLLPTLLTVTSTNINTGNVTLWVENAAGAKITLNRVVSPGGSATFIVPASLSGGNYYLKGQAVTYNTNYGFTVNQGDDDSLSFFQLTPGQWTRAYSFPNALPNSTLTITNSAYSPGPLTVRLLDENGAIIPIELIDGVIVLADNVDSASSTRQAATVDINAGQSTSIDINDSILFDVDFTTDVDTTDIFGSSASLSLN